MVVFGLVRSACLLLVSFFVPFSVQLPVNVTCEKVDFQAVLPAKSLDIASHEFGKSLIGVANTVFSVQRNEKIPVKQDVSPLPKTVAKRFEVGNASGLDLVREKNSKGSSGLSTEREEYEEEEEYREEGRKEEEEGKKEEEEGKEATEGAAQEDEDEEEEEEAEGSTSRVDQDRRVLSARKNLDLANVTLKWAENTTDNSTEEDIVDLLSPIEGYSTRRVEISTRLQENSSLELKLSDVPSEYGTTYKTQTSFTGYLSNIPTPTILDDSIRSTYLTRGYQTCTLKSTMDQGKLDKVLSNISIDTPTTVAMQVHSTNSTRGSTLSSKGSTAKTKGTSICTSTLACTTQGKSKLTTLHSSTCTKTPTATQPTTSKCSSTPTTCTTSKQTTNSSATTTSTCTTPRKDTTHPTCTTPDACHSPTQSELEFEEPLGPNFPLHQGSMKPPCGKSTKKSTVSRKGKLTKCPRVKFSRCKCRKNKNLKTLKVFMYEKNSVDVNTTVCASTCVSVGSTSTTLEATSTTVGSTSVGTTVVPTVGTTTVASCACSFQTVQTTELSSTTSKATETGVTTACSSTTTEKSREKVLSCDVEDDELPDFPLHPTEMTPGTTPPKPKTRRCTTTKSPTATYKRVQSKMNVKVGKPTRRAKPRATKGPASNEAAPRTTTHRKGKATKSRTTPEPSTTTEAEEEECDDEEDDEETTTTARPTPRRKRTTKAAVAHRKKPSRRSTTESSTEDDEMESTPVTEEVFPPDCKQLDKAEEPISTQLEDTEGIKDSSEGRKALMKSRQRHKASTVSGRNKTVTLHINPNGTNNTKGSGIENLVTHKIYKIKQYLFG